MTSPEFVQTKLTNRTQAHASSYEVEDNRYVYTLRFNDEIGFDWLETQVSKTAHEVERQLELWTFRGSMGPYASVEVREVNRREGIDENQNCLDDFS